MEHFQKAHPLSWLTDCLHLVCIGIFPQLKFYYATIEDCPAHSLVFCCKCQCVLGWRVCPNNDNIICWCCRPCHNCNFYGAFFIVATSVLLFAATEYLLVLSVCWSVGRKRAFQWSNLQPSFNIHGHTKGQCQQLLSCGPVLLGNATFGASGAECATESVNPFLLLLFLSVAQGLLVKWTIKAAVIVTIPTMDLVLLTSLLQFYWTMLCVLPPK